MRTCLRFITCMKNHSKKLGKRYLTMKNTRSSPNPVPDAPFILDCGSNIGISVLYFKSKYPGSRVLGFEPVPECFAILTKNIEENDLENVQITNAALVDSEGQICLYVGADHDLRGASISRSWGSQTTEDHIFVNSVRLSNYINGRVDFLKLDIEGAEEIVIPEIGE